MVVSEMGLQGGDDVYEIAYGHLEEDQEQGAGMSLNDLDRILDGVDRALGRPNSLSGLEG